MNEIFDRTIYIGPDINGKGGISAVLKSYSDNLPEFHYLQSNSRHGTLAGMFYLLYLLIALPVYKYVLGYKILHIHGASGKSFIRKSIIISWGKILGYKIIFHNHGAETREYYAKRGINVIRKTLDKCDHIVVLSSVWKDYYEQTFGYKNVSIVNNIVAHADTSIQAERHSNIRLLFLGHIGHRKGIFDLLDVISDNKDFFDNKIELIIGGNGEIEKLKSVIEQHKLQNMVKYIGWISGRSKFELLANCDILILPSYNEGLPISILEAMAYSKAVISTTVGGIPSIVKNGENGYITTPGDKSAIYNAIKHYIDCPQDITVHGENGLKKVSPFYPESVTKQLYDLYVSILKDA